MHLVTYVTRGAVRSNGPARCPVSVVRLTDHAPESLECTMAPIEDAPVCTLQTGWWPVVVQSLENCCPGLSAKVNEWKLFPACMPWAADSLVPAVLMWVSFAVIQSQLEGMVGPAFVGKEVCDIPGRCW